MPCYLFTYHAYRSWLPDRPQGFVQKGHGIQSPNPQLARAYRDAAKQAPVEFDRAVQRVLIEKMMDICQTESLRQHAASAEPTHVHVLVSWPADGRAWSQMRGRIQNLLSLHLSRRASVTGGRWFSRGASRKRVRDREHFNYLMRRYLPRHSGVQWYEDRGWVG
ncbi:MAG: hypothetical protein V3U29_00830 [Phycisphaeraceae bacterium]